VESLNESRRTFIKRYGLGAAGFSLLGPAILRSGARDRPNILYIMSDDHARQAMSCYGSRLLSTPNIDRIAQEGVRFNQSFCTNSICAPSRATILTGTYSHVNGQIDNALTFDGGQVTFPKLLRQAGYQTALVGKWHLKSDPTGFDYWNVLPGQGQYYNPDFIDMGKRSRVTGYATDLITDLALNWLQRSKKQRPFCLLLHHKAPHRNWLPGPKHLTLFNDVEFPLPETFFDDYESRQAARLQEMRIADHLRMASDCKLPPLPGRQEETAAERNDRLSWEADYGRMNDEQRKAWDAAYGPMIEEFRRTNPTGEELAKWKFQRYMQDYLRCIVSVDENVGRVLDYLDSEKLSGNTVVIYASDQGFYLGEHGWYDKRFMYEESLAFPLLVRFPAEIKPHVNTKDLVLNLDLAPTFLDYAGVSIPGTMQGESLREVCQQVTPGSWRQAMYYHYYEYPAVHQVKRHYGIRTHRYKLIHFYYDIDAWELFDLERDPHELHNVYGDPSYAPVVRELDAELHRLRKLYSDTDETRFLPR